MRNLFKSYVLKTLQRFPISLRIKCKILMCPTRPFMVPFSISSVRGVLSPYHCPFHLSALSWSFILVRLLVLEHARHVSASVFAHAVPSTWNALLRYPHGFSLTFIRSLMNVISPDYLIKIAYLTVTVTLYPLKFPYFS